MPVEITLDGVSLKQKGNPLVGPWDCYESQLAARHLFNGTHEFDWRPDSFVFMNTSPTGAGKSLSWVDNVIRNFIDAIALYPTNTLVQDQYENITRWIEDETFYDVGEEMTTKVITAETLEEERNKRDAPYNSNGELISTIIRETQRESKGSIVLTNPDIFTNARNGVYDSTMAKEICGEFDMVVVDEFHTADIGGQCTLINLLEQVRCDESTSVDIIGYTSATPDEKVMTKLKECDAPVIDVGDDTESRPLSKAKSKENYRAVMPAVDIEFRRGQTFQVGNQLTSDEWINNTVQFCKQADKNIIMLDSQKEVSQVTRTMRDMVGDEYEVMQIDGMNRVNLSEKLIKFNESEGKYILVSNSAVESGIDFSTDQVIFSGTSTSRLLQRLGRLRGREDTVKAIAYAPHTLVEAVERAKEEEEGRLTRERLQELLDAAFTRSRKPSTYPTNYAAHEAWEQAQRHAETVAPEKKELILTKAKRRIRKLFFKPHGIDFDEEEFNQKHKQLHSLMGTLMQYRSGMPSTLMYNMNKEKIQTHQIDGILRTGDIEIVTRDEFLERIPELTPELEEEIERRERHSYGHILYYGNEYVERPDEDMQDRNVMVAYTSELQAMQQEKLTERKPQELNTFQLVVDNRDMSPVDIEPLNKELREASPVVYPIPLSAYAAQAELGLDDFFFLTDVATGNDDELSVAIGHNALYLHCIRQENYIRRNPTKVDEVDHKITPDVFNRIRLEAGVTDEEQ